MNRERPLSVEVLFGESRRARYKYTITDTTTGQIVAESKRSESFAVLHKGSISVFNDVFDKFSGPSTVFTGNLKVEGDVKFGNPRDFTVIGKIPKIGKGFL